MDKKKILFSIGNFIPDKTFLKLKFRYKIGKNLNLKNPKTYNEKIQWLKLYDRNPYYTKCVDKVEVKKIVEDKIGKEYVIPTIGIYDNFDQINFDVLPKSFVIKCTHDSGGIVLCEDKTKLNLISCEKKINSSLKNNYYKNHREWPYKNIRPRIIVEKYIKDKKTKTLPDFKFFCFDGKVKFLFVAVDRPKNTKFNFYDTNFKRIPVKQHYPNFDVDVSKPKNFDKMIEICQKLSKGIPHVRIDLYNVNGKIYFGEMTFYHFSGFEKFEPEVYDIEFGSYIKLPLEDK